MDYGRRVEFGISVVPLETELETIRAAVGVAERSGLDLVGIQDHPYQWRFLAPWPASVPRDGTADDWVRLLADWVTVVGLHTFILWPVDADLGQIETFGKEVAPRVRAQVVRRRS